VQPVKVKVSVASAVLPKTVEQNAVAPAPAVIGKKRVKSKEAKAKAKAKARKVAEAKRKAAAKRKKAEAKRKKAEAKREAKRKAAARKVAKQQRALAKRQKALAKQQAATNKLLKALITTVKKQKAKKAPKPLPLVVKRAKKQLKTARVAQMKAEDAAFKAKLAVRRLKRAQAEKIRAVASKCVGKCPREMPIYVGPKNIRNTETRSVVVVGQDKAHNRKIWSSVHTHKKLLWKPKGITRARRHVKKAGVAILTAKKKHRLLTGAPLLSKVDLS